VKVQLLRARNLRCFGEFEFAPGAGVNWLVGPNAAGKTTVLEAAYLLSRGRSFRSGGRSAPCKAGSREFSIHATVSYGERIHRLELHRRDGNSTARLDAANLTSLAPLFEFCPVVCFEPDSHGLVTGPAEHRRRYLDWCVFHVEHGSLACWRDYRRALKQRNVLLRRAASVEAFLPWEHELGRLAKRLDAERRKCIASLTAFLTREIALLAPELGSPALDYRPGWNTDTELSQQLASQRTQDQRQGHTRAGAHRADWVMGFEQVKNPAHLSRGQAKAVALACVLAQMAWFAARFGQFPLLCLDDVDSELDAAHVRQVLDRLAGQPGQVWITTTSLPQSSSLDGSANVFHVEPAGIRRLPGMR
jgi:DNA replication and repair protein RecF